MRRMTVDFTDETFERIMEIQKMYDVDIDVIVAVAIKRFLDTERESTLLDVLDSRETLDR